MSADYTQQQTLGEQLEAEQLSLQATAPPAEVPGYRIERFLGAGAFGQVWVGRDLNTGRMVAIKFYLHRSGVNWSLLSREVKNLVALSADRHIVQILDVGWDADPPYYVMEYLENGSLEDLLHRRGSLPPAQAVALFREICLGLNHSHGKGVLHCDLKPANILLDDDYRPRLADFGQSRLSHDQTPALGTLFYMAPEQAHLEAVPDARWDVYGLGAILFRMLTGTAPHRQPKVLRRVDTAKSLPQRLERYRRMIRAAGVPREHYKLKGVDRRLAEIVDRCLAIDPEKRFANVQQVLEALEARDAARSRRPLMLLGIVGPLLLLTATSVFASRSVLQARRQFSQGMRQEALGSCQFAAKFAARTLEADLRSLYEAVQSEAEAEPFEEILTDALQDPELAQLRERIAEREAPAEARDELLENPPQQQLDAYLNQQLVANRTVFAGLRGPVMATMFVTDARGTMLAIAYSGPVVDDSAGRNFAYRTYFHGGSEDLPKSTPPSEIQPLRRLHLSAPFQSTATGLWKVAITAPVWLEEGPQHDRPPDALLVATINLGDFRLLTSVAVAGSADQAAALIDAREGRSRGTVLQHPLMDPRSSTENQWQDQVFRVPGDTLELLQIGENVAYVDPLSQAEGGEAFAGEWIAAVERVTLPALTVSSAHPPAPSDLLVLVQYRMSKVVEPVRALVERLLIEGAITVASILLVMFVLWYFVLRVGQPPTAIAAVERNPQTDATESVK